MCLLHTFYQRMENWREKNNRKLWLFFTTGVMTREDRQRREMFLFSFATREHPQNTTQHNPYRTQYRSNDEDLLPVSHSLFIHRHHVHPSFLFLITIIIIVILWSTICHLIFVSFAAHPPSHSVTCFVLLGQTPSTTDRQSFLSLFHRHKNLYKRWHYTQTRLSFHHSSLHDHSLMIILVFRLITLISHDTDTEPPFS